MENKDDKKPEKENIEKSGMENFLDGLKKSAEKLNETAEKMKNLSKIQNENKEKLKEMNEKLLNALKRLEEVRKRLAESRLNHLNETIKKIKEDKTEEPKPLADTDKKNTEKPAIFISKNEIFLSKISRNSFKEFTDFSEFLKFHKMDFISDDEYMALEVNMVVRKILE